MKKFLATILAFVYLIASSGATVHLHYCMGKLMRLDFSHGQGAKCGTCGMEKKDQKECCKDKQKVFQIEKDQKAAEFSFRFLNISSNAVAVVFANLPFVYPLSVIAGNPATNAPLRPGKVPVFILNRVFRI